MDGCEGERKSSARVLGELEGSGGLGCEVQANWLGRDGYGYIYLSTELQERWRHFLRKNNNKLTCTENQEPEFNVEMDHGAQLCRALGRRSWQSRAPES